MLRIPGLGKDGINNRDFAAGTKETIGGERGDLYCSCGFSKVERARVMMTISCLHTPGTFSIPSGYSNGP
jgi:hypothetical protein